MIPTRHAHLEPLLVALRHVYGEALAAELLPTQVAHVGTRPLALTPRRRAPGAASAASAAAHGAHGPRPRAAASPRGGACGPRLRVLVGAQRPAGIVGSAHLGVALVGVRPGGGAHVAGSCQLL